MVRDYAKRRPPQPRRGKRIFITIAIILVAMAAPILMYYFQYQKTIHHTARTTTPVAIKPLKPKTSATPKSTPQAKFDFYTILPNMQVPIPSSMKHSTYVLQVASLQSLQEAQQLKTKLFSLGCLARIESFQADDDTLWNRVLAGPYTNLHDAQKAQTMLHQQHIDSTLLLKSVLKAPN